MRTTIASTTMPARCRPALGPAMLAVRDEDSQIKQATSRWVLIMTCRTEKLFEPVLYQTAKGTLNQGRSR